MKRLKKFYKNNRVYCILMIISVICIFIMGITVAAYFLNQTTESPYGTRLEEIEEHEVQKDIDSLKDFYVNSKGVKSASVRLQGKIIYVEVDVDNKKENEDIQTLATTSLEKISKDNLNYYDIQFIFTRDDMYPYLGAKSSSNTIISWANCKSNSEDESDE